MNSGFEDTLVFTEVLDREGGNLSAAVTRFAAERRPDGDAIALLSYENYTEMRSHTASSLFVFRKRLEAGLHYLFPNAWIPLYSMVAFTRIPYSVALARARRQDTILTAVSRVTAVAALVGLAIAGRAVYSVRPGRMLKSAFPRSCFALRSCVLRHSTLLRLS